LYNPSDGRFFSFNLPGGRFALLIRVSYATEYKSKPTRNFHLCKINSIISLKHRSPTSRLKCLVCNLTKTRAEQPIRPVRSWPNLFSDSIRFCCKKRANTSADRKCKAENNCSLPYSTNSPPTAVVSIVHAWVLNTELETGLEIYKRQSRIRLMLPILKPHCRCLQRVGY